MSDTPTSKVEALRESFLRLGACSGPYDTPHRCSSMHCNYCELCDVSEDVLKAFATFLEGVAEEQSTSVIEHGANFNDMKQYNAVPVSAIHQVVTALRRGE